MAFESPYAAYQSTRTNTARKTQLLVMLHDGAIRFLTLAAAGIREKDFNKKGVNINKALSIIDHLWGTLDHKPNAELAGNLERLYVYLRGRLVVANAKNDLEIISEMIAHLREIRSAWNTVDEEICAQKEPAAQRLPGEQLQIAA
jgi:flagellar protein FliS